MSSIGLEATVRQQGGKGEARRLRRGGQIPAVAYGKREESLALSVSPKDLLAILRSERGRNTVVELKVGGKGAMPTLVTDVQVHPVTRELLHADFLRVDLSAPVDVRVKVEVTGRSEGMVMGGKLQQVFRTLPIRCLPLQVPVKLVVDISGVGLDQALTVKDLVLPEGVTVTLPPNQTVLGIFADKRKKEEEAKEAEAAAAAPAKGK